MTAKDFNGIFSGVALDEKSVKDVSFKSIPSMDSSELWLKFHCSDGDFRTILARLPMDLAVNSGPPTKVGREIDVPSSWPASKEVPSWWNLPLTRTDLNFTRWENQVDNNPYSSRARGMYVVYEPSSETAWVCFWNHQHHRL